VDSNTFDSLTRRLVSRRTGVLGIAVPVAEAKKKKKKPCPLCKKRKKGKCKANLPDGTGCSGGTCQAGTCVASTPPTTVPPTTQPPAFCASQPDGAPCGFCRKCQSGVCQADVAQNASSCGSAGGLCWDGTCNPVPTCSPRYGACQTAADCCSNGSVNAPTTCPASGNGAHTCQGRPDPGQPCLGEGHCTAGTSCVAYVCR
jgi:hypothetical protein